MVAGLTYLELAETLGGTWYGGNLLLNSAGWAAKNMKGDADGKFLWLLQICGVLCIAVRFYLHHCRTVGGRGDMNGIKLDQAVAAVWGTIAYLNVRLALSLVSSVLTSHRTSRHRLSVQVAGSSHGGGYDERVRVRCVRSRFHLVLIRDDQAQSAVARIESALRLKCR